MRFLFQKFGTDSVNDAYEVAWVAPEIQPIH